MAGWAWWTGRLKRIGFDDAAAATAFVLGARLASTGKLGLGLLVMAAAVSWMIYRRKAPSKPAMAPDEARRLLGLGEAASLRDIREAHRRLITKVHPDAGGSAELATRVNAARDVLVAEMNRRTPRAS